MNFVKKNLVPLVCGLVVLLFIGAYFWPIGSWQSSLQDEMKARFASVGQAKSLVTKITIPGGATLENATYEQNLIDAGTQAVSAMDKQSKELVTKAADQNRKGRVLTAAEFTNTYHIPINNGATEVPLLGNAQLPNSPRPYFTAEANYLPVMTSGVLANPQRFKTHYQNIYHIWNTQLVGKDVIAVPPSQSEIQTAYTNEQAAKAKPLVANGMFGGTAAAQGAVDPNEINKYERDAIARRAADIHMYVDANALQKRDWINSPSAPDETKIFDAVVDSWFQQDFINAIVDVNKGSPNVGKSPIKRLESLRIGVAPGAAPGAAPTGLFLAAAAGGAAPAAAPAGGDFSRTMTGRIDNDQYDVTLVEIVVDIDPAYQNKFIDALYRQNNGYTVLNIKTDSVDPFDATGNGYLYGNTQVVHLDILVEALLYRSWTVPLMPDPIRASLGIPLLPPPGTPAPAAAPGT